MTSESRYSAEVLRTTVCNFIVATVIDLWRHLAYASRIISEMLPEILTIEKYYFLKPMIHSQIIYLSIVLVCMYYSRTLMARTPLGQ